MSIVNTSNIYMEKRVLHLKFRVYINFVFINKLGMKIDETKYYTQDSKVKEKICV